MPNSYLSYINSPEWKETANIIKQKKGNFCNNCGSSEKLQVHHINYNYLYSELDNLDSVVVLCNDCHKFEHDVNNDIKRIKLKRGL